MVLALTSQPQSETFLSLERWQDAGLIGPTWIKPTVFCLAESIIERQIGSIATEDAFRVADALKLIIAKDFRL